MTRKTILFAVFVLMFVPAIFAWQPASYKSLGGTADEMDSMRLPDPATEGVRSKTAMLPIRFEKGRATFDIPIESSDSLRISLIAPNSGSWEIAAAQRGGKSIDLRRNRELVEREAAQVGIDGLSFPAEVFTMQGTRSGRWQIQVSTRETNLRAGTAGYLVITTGSPIKAYSFVGTRQTTVGSDIPITAYVFDETSTDDSLLPRPLVDSVRTIFGEITFPDGSSRKLDFDGTGGVFTGLFRPQTAGQYQVRIQIEGVTPNGEGFVRTSEQIVQVIGDNGSIGKSAYSTTIDDFRMQVNIPIHGLSNGRKVVVYGEIYARGGVSSEPVAWIGGMTNAESRGTVLPITVDGRWFAGFDSKGGFEIRNLRIQDPDYFVTIAESESLDLAVTDIPELAASFSGPVNDEMRMGRKPVNEQRDSAVGGKLMLVHGYCSGGNSFTSSQFTEKIIFHDPNANRTHDQFANLIRNFGASYPSFGIVAHSQGGAASLHLYTYYWSGLDYATGNRLIQSVGTPYQGTALAGNLAALGSVFGAGCGTNYDLSYSGASAWLSGIPTWARAKVNYYTTSFKDVWWRYDYCNIATDLFLNDPDDGVIEQTKGQLSSAINRGHKTGWCHTTGMRDPGQTTDSARNSEMNTNAAR